MSAALLVALALYSDPIAVADPFAGSDDPLAPFPGEPVVCDALDTTLDPDCVPADAPTPGAAGPVPGGPDAAPVDPAGPAEPSEPIDPSESTTNTREADGSAPTPDIRSSADPLPPPCGGSSPWAPLRLRIAGEWSPSDRRTAGTATRRTTEDTWRLELRLDWSAARAGSGASCGGRS